VFGGVEVVITDDVAGAIAAMKPLTAMYVGGMGSATHNYHRAAMARRGFPEEAARIQELWLAGRRDEAVAAIPDEYHDDGALIGSPERIRSRWHAWTTRGFTGLTVRSQQPEAFEMLADLAGTRDEEQS
jgi:alkanesulfonate monooxygenase SsuD/methylene tetrahydromethanopterin reductase-like flavin-dependent oxidoreductase (luciferase family)